MEGSNGLEGAGLQPALSGAPKLPVPALKKPAAISEVTRAAVGSCQDGSWRVRVSQRISRRVCLQARSRPEDFAMAAIRRASKFSRWYFFLTACSQTARLHALAEARSRGGTCSGGIFSRFSALGLQ